MVVDKERERIKKEKEDARREKKKKDMQKLVTEVDLIHLEENSENDISFVASKLNEAERQFATLIAGGCTVTEAYMKVFPSRCLGKSKLSVVSAGHYLNNKDKIIKYKNEVMRKQAKIIADNSIWTKTDSIADLNYLKNVSQEETVRKLDGINLDLEIMHMELNQNAGEITKIEDLIEVENEKAEPDKAKIKSLENKKLAEEKERLNLLKRLAKKLQTNAISRNASTAWLETIKELNTIMGYDGENAGTDSHVTFITMSDDGEEVHE